MVRLSLLALSWAALVIRPILSLEVTPGSSCASFCLDDGQDDASDPLASSTNATDITCRDVMYSNDEAGIKYRNCVQCLAKSDRVDGDESDLHWYLYNLRYTLSTCLFGFPGNSSDSQVQSPCIIDHACRPLEGPLISDDLEADAMDTFGYCEAEEGAFMARTTWTCVDCLRASNEQKFFSNFVTALQAACKQRPEPGEKVSLTGSVFSTTGINATDPEEDILERPEGAGSSTLTTGAIVGIAVGVGLLVVSVIALFIMHRRRQKRMRDNEKSDYPGGTSHSNTPDPMLPPDGNHMSASLRSYSQQSNHRPDPSGRGANSGEYYDKLEGDISGLGLRNDPRAVDRSRTRGGSQPAGYPQYVPRNVSRLRDQMDPNGPTHPAAVHRYSKSIPNTNTYALETYDISTGPTQPRQTRTTASNRRSASVGGGITTIPPPPPGPPPSKNGQGSTPSISLPSLSKLRLPKKYAPPAVSNPESDGLNIDQPGTAR